MGPQLLHFPRRPHAPQRFQKPRPRLLPCLMGSLFVGIPSVELNMQDGGVEGPEIQADHVRN